MGAGASIGDGPVDRNTAQSLAGETWSSVESAFDFEANDNGEVSADRVREFASGVILAPFQTPQSPLREGKSPSPRITRLPSFHEEDEDLENEICSKGKSLWRFLKLVHSTTRTINKCRAHDLEDHAVKAMLELIDSCPVLARQDLDDKIRSAAMEENEVLERAEARRARIRREAAEHLARFEALGEDERRAALDEGDLDLYTEENQIKREAMFDDDLEINELLDKWWRSTEVYLDRDHNDVLTRDEYRDFHARLRRLITGGGGGGRNIVLSGEEEEALMDADFASDSGADGSVDREEFRYAVFQLADQWTSSVEVGEYVAFLERGHGVVFGDLIAADQLQFPESWRADLASAKCVSAMPASRAADALTGILSAKIAADKVHAARGTAPQTMAEFTRDYFVHKHGQGPPFKKRFKGFVLSLVDMCEDEAHPVHDYALLFAQMCGIHTPSGRIKALPEKAGTFVLSHLDGVSRILKQTTSTVKAVNERGLEAKLGIDARSNSLMCGFLDYHATRVYLEKILAREMKLKPDAPLYKVAVVSLTALATTASSAAPSSATDQGGRGGGGGGGGGIKEGDERGEGGDTAAAPSSSSTSSSSSSSSSFDNRGGIQLVRASAGTDSGGTESQSTQRFVPAMRFSILLGVVYAAWHSTVVAMKEGADTPTRAAIVKDQTKALDRLKAQPLVPTHEPRAARTDRRVSSGSSVDSAGSSKSRRSSKGRRVSSGSSVDSAGSSKSRRSSKGKAEKVAQEKAAAQALAALERQEST